ncbi:MAG: hypothetical protein V3V96_15515 [Acidiferrobacterales bacterium]
MSGRWYAVRFRQKDAEKILTAGYFPTRFFAEDLIRAQALEYSKTFLPRWWIEEVNLDLGEEK